MAYHMRTEKRLTSLYQQAKVITYTNASKYVIMSDCHRGTGNWTDNFLPNQNLFFAALQHYYDNGFTYIELGDGDELWENRDFNNIVEVHSDAFWIMEKFYHDKRFYMLYGNHDIVKRNSKYVDKNMKKYYCDSTKKFCPLFPDLVVYEGLILEHEDTYNTIFLVHGHQGDIINDELWPLGRFLVRYVWRRLELLGVKDPYNSDINPKKKNKIETQLSKWSDDHDQIIIAGHTHRAVFPGIREPKYFNDGSCIHPRCITALEIEDNAISLVKWSVLTKPDGSLYVGKTTLEGPVELLQYFVK